MAANLMDSEIVEGDTDLLHDVMRSDIDNYFKMKLMKFHEKKNNTEDAFVVEEETKPKATELESQLFDFLSGMETFINKDDLIDFNQPESESDDDDDDDDDDDGSSVTCSTVGEAETGLSLLDLDDEGLMRELEQREVETAEQCIDCGVWVSAMEGERMEAWIAHTESEEHVSYMEKQNKKKEKQADKQGTGGFVELKMQPASFHVGEPKCMDCGKYFTTAPNGNIKEALYAHCKSEYHVNFMKKKNEKKIIVKDENGYTKCVICNLVILGGNRSVLSHCQGQQHREMLSNRFASNAEALKPKPKEPKVEEKVSNDKLVYAMGMACIQPFSATQMQCTMCESKIPVANDFANLMRNVASHIQGSTHLKNLRETETKLKEIKTQNPDLKEMQEQLKTEETDDNGHKVVNEPYKFICLPCEWDGHGFLYCKSHMRSSKHLENVERAISNDVYQKVNFDKGIMCRKCLKYIFGTFDGIGQHFASCTHERKEGDASNVGRRRRRGTRTPKQNESDGNQNLTEGGSQDSNVLRGGRNRRYPRHRGANHSTSRNEDGGNTNSGNANNQRGGNQNRGGGRNQRGGGNQLAQSSRGGRNQNSRGGGKQNPRGEGNQQPQNSRGGGNQNSTKPKVQDGTNKEKVSRDNQGTDQVSKMKAPRHTKVDESVYPSNVTLNSTRRAKNKKDNCCIS